VTFGPGWLGWVISGPCRLSRVIFLAIFVESNYCWAIFVKLCYFGASLVELVYYWAMFVGFGYILAIFVELDFVTGHVC